jgi:GNAT superfamily N-acetyltransferase
MLKWWEARVDEVRTGTRSIMFASPDREESMVAGVVMLSKPPSETGPFRGIVEKLLVNPSLRRRGVATTLMLKLEEAAAAEGQPLLVSLFFIFELDENSPVLTDFKLLDTEKESGVSSQDVTPIRRANDNPW